MDIKNHGNNLVPGQGRPANLDQLRKLASPQPLAARHAADAAVSASARPRRFRRAGRAWTGALALGAVLAAAGALVLLDEGSLLPFQARGLESLKPAMPDQGLSRAEKEKAWSLAAYEPSRFPALIGAPESDLDRQERDARRPERLLSETAPPAAE